MRRSGPSLRKQSWQTRRDLYAHQALEVNLSPGFTFGLCSERRLALGKRSLRDINFKWQRRFAAVAYNLISKWQDWREKSFLRLLRAWRDARSAAKIQTSSVIMRTTGAERIPSCEAGPQMTLQNTRLSHVVSGVTELQGCSTDL